MASLRWTTTPWLVALLVAVGAGCSAETPEPGDPIGVSPPTPIPEPPSPEESLTPLPTDPMGTATTPPVEATPTAPDASPSPEPGTDPPATPGPTADPFTPTPTPIPGTPASDPDGDGDTYPAGTDCDDQNAQIHPNAAEVCNSIDDDCDGLIDAADVGSPLDTWYKDNDEDGWGNNEQEIHACQQPQGSVDRGGDCNDTSALINPDAAEVCDTKDNDCDDKIDDVDDNTVNEPTWYKDVDTDGWGGTQSANTCSRPLGYIPAGGDCDDDDAQIHPQADEICNDIDDDCDGSIDDDDDLAEGPIWFQDEDGDGYGSDEEQVACDQPEGYVEDAGDCDDEDTQLNPDTIWYADVDGDNFGDEANTLQQCEAPDGYLKFAEDCDDLDEDIHPGVAEICDDKDQDCDGVIDDGVIVDGGLAWWQAEGNAQDSVGIYNGTASGDLSYGTGYSGQGFVFDGSGDKLNFGSSVGNFGTGDFAIEFWMKTPNRGNQAILGKRSACEHGTYFDLRTQGQSLKWELEEGDGTYLTLLSITKVADDEWYHVVLVRRGLAAELYINGQLENSKSGSTAPHIENSANFEVGVSACTGKDGTTYYKGILDEIIVYNRAFSEGEVTQLFVLGSLTRCVLP